MKRRTRFVACGAIVAAACAGALILSRSPGQLPASNAAAALVPATGWLDTPAVQHFSAADSVGRLGVLVSAGSGSNGVAVVTGADAAGERCWTIVEGGGAVGSGFRCGTAVGSGVGDPTDHSDLRVVCQTSGSSGATTADSAGCLGFVGMDVATVAVQLADGSSQKLAVTGGAFAYASDNPDKLPTSVAAYDGTGHALAHEDIVLGSGLGSG
jgi:hypothetical protein